MEKNIVVSRRGVMRIAGDISPYLSFLTCDISLLPESAVQIKDSKAFYLLFLLYGGRYGT